MKFPSKNLNEIRAWIGVIGQIVGYKEIFFLETSMFVLCTTNWSFGSILIYSFYKRENFTF